jgi:exonuclease III
MICCSFNARGLGSRVKRRKIRDLVQSEKLDFLAIQETKMEAIPDSFVHNLWEVVSAGGLIYRRWEIVAEFYRFGTR